MSKQKQTKQINLIQVQDFTDCLSDMQANITKLLSTSNILDYHKMTKALESLSKITGDLEYFTVEYLTVLNKHKKTITN